MKYKVLSSQNVSKNCIVCGVEGKLSLRTQFFVLENGWLAGVPRALFEHQSFPGRMHGGVIAALLDETVGRAYQIARPDDWAVTAELVTRYRKPVPLDQKIYVVGRITSDSSRLFTGEGKIILAETGEVLAAATAKYFKLPVASIADAGFLHTDWFKDIREVPAEIELSDGLFG
jgi:acyl-coenzyme A thioesterase PaaI-like protein